MRISHNENIDSDKNKKTQTDTSSTEKNRLHLNYKENTKKTDNTGKTMTFSNREMIYELLNAFKQIIGQKTSAGYANVVIKSLIKKLEKKFGFLRYVKNIGQEEYTIKPKINEISKEEVCKAIEALIRIVYMDLKREAGAFFLSEIEAKTKPGFIPELREHGTDIDLLKMEHQLLFRDFDRMKFKHNVDTSRDASLKKEIEKEILLELNEKDKRFLKILQNEDLNREEALEKLDISQDELKIIVNKLIHLNYLEYISNHEIALTEKALKHLTVEK
ncbi:MAG: hypothetical protein V5A68_04605 [Candidatus Thermoplasmatota archaeon]